MQTRLLGASGVQVSLIGFGAWGIGGSTGEATCYGETDDKISMAALRRAREQGITFFDTAPAYGNGRSERLIGEVFSGNIREQVVLATKGGYRDFRQPADFSVTMLKSQLVESLKRLKTEYVDLFQLHNPDVERMLHEEDILKMSLEMKANGMIRAFGVSVRTPEEGLIALQKIKPDAIQANFNILDQRALDCGLFAAAEKSGAAIIARTPLCFGFLSGHIGERQLFDRDDHRSRWSREQITLWIKSGREIIMKANRKQFMTPAQVALRYCTSFPVVASTIPGMLNRDEVDENAAVLGMDPFEENELGVFREYYKSASFFIQNMDGTKNDPASE